MGEDVRIVLATHNPGKRREWLKLLDGLDLDLLLPEEVGVESQVAETGDTYKANALIKARALCQATGLPALADDSGLEVDVLDGAPGIRSARFHPGDDESRYAALLRAMEGVPEAERSARFRCIAALVLPSGETFTTEGVCEGVISTSASGKGGFGYDPVFYLPEIGCTMAELPGGVKNEISHRARAAQALRPILVAELGA